MRDGGSTQASGQAQRRPLWRKSIRPGSSDRTRDPARGAPGRSLSARETAIPMASPPRGSARLAPEGLAQVAGRPPIFPRSIATSAGYRSCARCRCLQAARSALARPACPGSARAAARFGNRTRRVTPRRIEARRALRLQVYAMRALARPSKHPFRRPIMTRSTYSGMRQCKGRAVAACATALGQRSCSARAGRRLLCCGGRSHQLADTDHTADQ